MTDKQELQTDAGIARSFTITYLNKWFGERCPDFDENCECCRRWKLLDDLFANPFENDDE